MRRFQLLSAALAAVAFLVALAAKGSAEPDASPPPIHLSIFLSKTCPHCELIQPESLKRAQEKYRCRIVPHYHNVDDMTEYARLVALERRLGKSGGDLPVVIVAGRVIGGVKPIEAQLPALLTSLRETGSAETPAATAQEVAAVLAPASRVAGPIHAAYFEEPGCRQCARAERILALAKAQYPTLQIRRGTDRAREETVLLEALCERAKVPEARRMLRPAIFIGQRAAVEKEIDDAKVLGLCASYAGGPPNWELTATEREAAESRLWERARSVTLAAVVIGGLIDGVNPCAFATLIFLVCCLTAAGRERRAVWLVGAGFAAGVFCAYFLAGVGLRDGLQRLEFLPRVSLAVTWVIIAITLALGLLSAWDFVVALRGRKENMALQLPQKLRLRINSMIARNLRTRSLFLGAFGLGAIISILEFVCTGQVYLPLIRYMVSVSGSRARGLGLLVLYNAAFILPLLAVFAAVGLGAQSDRLRDTFGRYLPVTKLLLALLFLGLGALLLWMQLRGTL